MDIFSLVGKITVNYGEAVKGIDEVSSKAGGLASSLGKTTQDVGQKITSIGDKMSLVGKSFAPVSVAVGGVATAAVKTATDFDSAMSKVSAISGATGEKFEELRNKAIEMGGKTKFSASEAAEAMNYMAMAGWDAEDMISGIDGIMNLAAASGEDLATTSDIVTDALTAFGLSAGDSGHFANILAAASSNANTNVSMLGESFKYVAPVAGAMGYSAEDVSIALGLMANAGIKASQSGTSLRTLMTNMANPTDTVAAAMDALGISLTDSEGNMYSFREMMDNLRSGFGNLHPEVELSEEQIADLDAQLVSLAEQYESGMISQEEYESSVSALTGSVYGNAQAEQAKYAAMLAGKEGMSGLLAIVNASEEDYSELAGAIDNCKDAAKDMADTMQDNLAGDITALGSQLETLALSVVDLFTPALRNVVAHVQDFVKWLSGLDDSTKIMIGTIAMVLAALSPVIITIGKVISAIGSITGVIGKVINLGGTIIGGIGKVTTIVPKIIGVVSSVTGFITGTVIPVIGTVVSAIGVVPIAITAAIATVIGVIVLLWNKCDWFREGVIAIWEAIKSAAIAAWSAIKDFLINLWDEIAQFGKTVFEGLASFLSTCWQGIQTMFSTVLSAISALFTTIWNGIKTVVTTVSTAIQSFLTATWNNIKSFISTVLKAIQTTFTTVWNAIKAVITTVINAIKSYITTAWNAIKSTISNVLNTIKSVVTNVWNGIKSVVTNIINSLKSFITSAFNAIKTVITNVLNGIKSVVSTVWNAIKSTISTILNSIKATVSTVWNAIKNTISTVTNAIKAVISTAWNAIKTVVTTAVGGIQNFITTAWNTIKAIVTTVMSTIQSVISNAWNGVRETIGSVINGIQSTISGGLEGAKNIAANVLGAIKDKFSSIFDGAVGIVKGAIDKIKSFFNFSWSLPKIKLPHFSISGKFSLNPPSIPKFGVQWYAKAMRDGMIMNQPTIFGYNAKSKQLLAGGEAGSETVVGTESLMNMIKSAVASENGELISILKQILEAITDLNDGLGEKFYEALLSMKFLINEREFARLVKAV